MSSSPPLSSISSFSPSSSSHHPPLPPASSSTAIPLPPPPTTFQQPNITTSPTSDNASTSITGGSGTGGAGIQPPELSLTDARKTQFLKHLLKCLDLLACCHLIIVYLHDVSTFRLLLRGIIQAIFLSPRIFGIALPPVFNKRPIISLIVGTNLYCLIRHIFQGLYSNVISHSTPAPQAPPYIGPLSPNLGVGSDPSGLSSSQYALPTSQLHSYLHGGLTIEFIGELPYASCLPFVVLDLSILLVQLALFCLAFSHSAASGGSNSGTSSASTTSNNQDQLFESSGDEDQDLGDLENQTNSISSSVLPLPPSSTSPSLGTVGTQSNNNNNSNTPNPPSVEESMYTSYSGQLVVAHIEIFKTLKQAWSSHLVAAAAAAAASGSSATSSNPNNNNSSSSLAVSSPSYGSTTEPSQPPQQQQRVQQNLDPTGALARLLRSIS